MKNPQPWTIVLLIGATGYVAACSSDGTGPVPPGALHGSGGSTAQDTLPSSSTGSGGASSTVYTTGVGGTASASTAGSIAPAGGATVASSTPLGSTGVAGTMAGSTGAGGTIAGGSSKTAGTTAATTAGGGVVTGGASGAGGGTQPGGTVAGATATGGNGSVPTGGTTGTGTGSGTGSNWWPVAFSSATLPNPSNGNHNAGRACLSCHGSGGSAPSWLFGGTVYDAAGTAGLGHLQIGIKDGTKFFSAYSATNGNIWLPTASNTINWSTAEIRIRSATGEKIMGKAATSGDCNGCHSSGNRIVAP